MQHIQNHKTDSQKSAEKENASMSSEERGGSKEVTFLAVGLMVLVIGIGGVLMYSEDETFQITQSKKFDATQTSSEPAGTSALPIAFATPASTNQEPTPFDQNVYFDFDQALLSEESKILLEERVQFLNDKQNWTLMIQVHTDEQGPDIYNQALGLRRAEAVKQHLVNLGIPADSIQIESLGKEGAVCTEEAEECYWQNRRTHLVFMTPETQSSEPLPLVTETDPVEPEETANPDELPTKVAESEQDDSAETASKSETTDEVIPSDTVATAVSTP